MKVAFRCSNCVKGCDQCTDGFTHKELAACTDSEVLEAYRVATSNKLRTADHIRAEAFRRGLLHYE